MYKKYLLLIMLASAKADLKETFAEMVKNPTKTAWFTDSAQMMDLASCAPADMLVQHRIAAYLMPIYAYQPGQTAEAFKAAWNSMYQLARESEANQLPKLFAALDKIQAENIQQFDAIFGLFEQRMRAITIALLAPMLTNLRQDVKDANLDCTQVDQWLTKVRGAQENPSQGAGSINKVTVASSIDQKPWYSIFFCADTEPKQQPVCAEVDQVTQGKVGASGYCDDMTITWPTISLPDASCCKGDTTKSTQFIPVTQEMQPVTEGDAAAQDSPLDETTAQVPTTGGMSMKRSAADRAISSQSRFIPHSGSSILTRHNSKFSVRPTTQPVAQQTAQPEAQTPQTTAQGGTN